MISTSGDAQAGDPTLTALVPLRSRWLDLGRLLAVVVLLVGVGWLGVNGRPGLSSTGGAASVLADAQVLVAAQTTARGIPGPTLTSITPPPGSAVAGAWVLDTDDPLLGGPETAWDAQDVRDQLIAGARADRALPQLLTAGREVDLVVLLDVVDCATLLASDDGPVDGSSTAHLRSGLGISADAPLQVLGFWADSVTLAEQGTCPSS